MSVLLDALRRAEQEKQARPDERDAAARAASRANLELAPLPSAAAPAPARAPAPAATPPSAKVPAAPRARNVLWIGAGLVLLVLGIAAGYVWYSIASLAPKATASAVGPRPVAAASAPVAPPAAPVPDNSPVAAQMPAVPRPTPPAREAVAAAHESRSAMPSQAASTTAPAPALLQPAPALERPRVPAQVAAGYDALRKGDLAAARQSYAAAAAADPTSLDATLGLATVEARAGRREPAIALYRRTLELDARNATAIAGLAALGDASQPEALEAQLARDIAQHPSSAPLHLMLGNLHASQSRWSQAQAAYFEAHRLDPQSPDILHNLAVSLDRLGQSRVAAGFYRRALDAARVQAAQMDPAAVERRLAEIQDDAPTSRGPPAAR